ncbi:MAG: hypothetical protein ABI142_11470, partial [Bryocella sp.]
MIAIAVVATIFSSKLGGLTVAFGVAGAGVAFALQEVIASAARWVVVSVSNTIQLEIAFNLVVSRRCDRHRNPAHDL